MEQKDVQPSLSEFEKGLLQAVKDMNAAKKIEKKQMTCKMDNDRNTLELAAKAAGFWFEWDFDEHHEGPSIIEDYCPVEWSPLENDGDAFRLAVHLRLTLEFRDGGAFAHCDLCGQDNPVSANNFDDLAEAARRAIVGAAAEIGRRMTFADSPPEDDHEQDA
jgi:hypothetical protein